MNKQQIRCGILGAQEKDLYVFSELHRLENIEIAFVYDTDAQAVGMDIAEILQVRRLHAAEQLYDVEDLSYLVVTEPRVRFAAEIEILSKTNARLLTPPEALELFTDRGEPAPVAVTLGDDAKEPEIEDALDAFDKLFDRRELLKFLLDVAVKATGASAGSVMLYSSETRDLYIAYGLGLSERVVKNTRQTLGDGIAGGVALNREARLIDNPPDQSLYAKDRERMDITSAICVPLIWEGQLLGVLNVSTGGSDTPLRQTDLFALKKLSRRLSKILHQSQKIQQVHAKHRESKFRKTMGEIADKPLSAQEKFSMLCQYLSELIGADIVEIYLNTEEGDWFVLGGSNRLLTPREERIRCQRGALSRAFLERRCVILTEAKEGDAKTDDLMSPASSAVYCYMDLGEANGVLVVEFEERDHLLEFLVLKTEITSELSRFVGAELRERRLRREVRASSRISDAASALLSCRSIHELGDVLARVVADVLECKRVSVRLRKSAEDPDVHVAYLTPPGDRSEAWTNEDQARYERLATRKEPFTMAFLSFESAVRREPADYHSLLAYPILGTGVLHGGIVAYDKTPSDPLEDAVFSTTDQNTLRNTCALILPVIDSLTQRGGEVDAEPKAYDDVLAANRERFIKLCTSEISRSDRYHHSFSVILFRSNALRALLDSDLRRGLALVDEITRGVQTRTRKTDYGTWIDLNTYAIISLDGGTRVRFLINRASIYLRKDLSQVEGLVVGDDDILYGTATYPGTARTAEELIQEAEQALHRYEQD